MQEIELRWIWLGLCMFIVSFSVSYGIFPMVLRMARVWGFYDNPDARKLQRKPVPVMGGLCVYCAIFISSFVVLGFAYQIKVIYMMLAMGLLLAVGMIDDKRRLNVSVRFLIETLSIVCIIYLNRNYINTFNGLWEVEHLQNWIALPLSLFAGVGIVNAINLMDGVDGYSSSYVSLSCCCFACIFLASNIPMMSVLCMICAGSIIPFILHNVFGKKTKMFIGDGGTLMMGMMITVFCFSILKEGSLCYVNLQQNHGIGLIPLTLAILSVSIFDTLRVMSVRMFHGKSPFQPDKNHLHHMFIDAGFSHAGTTLSLLILNILVILGWFVSWIAGASVELQLYVVLAISILNTAGLHILMERGRKKEGRIYRKFCKIGSATHWNDTAFWKWMQRLVDDQMFEEGKID